jgi:hypothetical protein|tara:strand:- start:280 stop:480 length:201 start_codon:yes stop_codon:yes gene_type:complete
MKLWKIYNTTIKDYLVDNKGKVATYTMRRKAKQEADDFNSMRKDNPYEVVELNPKPIKLNKGKTNG